MNIYILTYYERGSRRQREGLVEAESLVQACKKALHGFGRRRKLYVRQPSLEERHKLLRGYSEASWESVGPKLGFSEAEIAELKEQEREKETQRQAAIQLRKQQVVERRLEAKANRILRKMRECGLSDEDIRQIITRAREGREKSIEPCWPLKIAIK